VTKHYDMFVATHATELVCFSSALPRAHPGDMMTIGNLSTAALQSVQPNLTEQTNCLSGPSDTRKSRIVVLQLSYEQLSFVSFRDSF
jgi:hypothetical protein